MRHKLKHIYQITVRGLDPGLEAEIRRVADEEGISLNKAALRILRKGAGLQDRPARQVIGNGLDHLIGTWDETEAKQFTASIRSCEQIDRELWK
jgi:hypothetical protein